MTAVEELDARKASVVRDILNNVNTAELVERLNVFVRQLVGEEPCQYSVEEMDNILDEAEQAMDNGEGMSSQTVFDAIEAKYPFLCK